VCELPATRGLPLSKFSRVELHRLVIERGVTDDSSSTMWRWCMRTRSSRGRPARGSSRATPVFAEKAGRVLDLYARTFEGTRLRPHEYVICVDEETQTQ